ncbi:MAG: GntR family transcriptional regulator [Mycetocola sp.]
MLFRIDHASAVSLAEQLAIQVRRDVDNGTLSQGDRLPPARELATALSINMHTVLRAYQSLKDEGYVEMRRGRGAWISSQAAPGRARLTQLATEIRAEADKLGLSTDDLIRLIRGEHTP